MPVFTACLVLRNPKKKIPSSRDELLQGTDTVNEICWPCPSLKPYLIEDRGKGTCHAIVERMSHSNARKNETHGGSRVEGTSCCTKTTWIAVEYVEGTVHSISHPFLNFSQTPSSTGGHFVCVPVGITWELLKESLSLTLNENKLSMR